MILIFTLFLLQLADWYTTRTILNKGGYEQNPIMAYVIKHFGIDIALGFKAVLVTLLGANLYYLLFPALVFINLFYVFIIYHNYKSL